MGFKKVNLSWGYQYISTKKAPSGSPKTVSLVFKSSGASVSGPGYASRYFSDVDKAEKFALRRAKRYL